MSRLTRSQRRDNDILEDAPDMAQPMENTSSPPRVNNRAPLGVITANNVDEDATAAAHEQPVGEDPIKQKGNGKKKKHARKSKKKDARPALRKDEQPVGLVEAVEAACEEMMKPTKPDNQQPQNHGELSTTPPATILPAPQQQVAPHTPPAHPETRAPVIESNVGANETANEPDDSFVQAIVCRSPAKAPVPSLAESQNTAGDDGSSSHAPADCKKETAILELVQMTSPAKSPNRIEDSVDAIDALEEALSQVDEALPALNPPVKCSRPLKQGTKKPVEHRTRPGEVNTTKHKLAVNALGKRVKPEPGVKAQAARAVATTKTTAPPKISKPVLAKSLAPSASTKPRSSAARVSPSSAPGAGHPTLSKAPSPSRSSQVEMQKGTAKTKARKPSMSLRPPPPIAKSTKAPTRPTFELPGEAISRKLKEQREEKLKRQAEEQQKKREFKARPVRTSTAPPVKANAASRAREGIQGGSTTVRSNGQAKPAMLPTRPSTISTPTHTKRPSILNANWQPLIKTDHSGPRTPAPGATSVLAHRPSFSAHKTGSDKPQAVASVKKIQRQPAPIKPVPVRNAEQEKMDKEKAARKAREEAAERGRLASRAWADKQKAKLKSQAGKGTIGRAQGKAIKA